MKIWNLYNFITTLKGDYIVYLFPHFSQYKSGPHTFGGYKDL